jgi:hypothetical protein
MIRRKTVFVLGAGASKPYGLPLGAELRKYICQGGSQHNLAQVFYEHCGISRHETERFCGLFMRSGRGSIDAFLANRSDLSTLGKLAIAYELCIKEIPDTVFRIENTDNWYSTLWDKMVEDVTSGLDISRNKVRFVTFNYDRSLELFFHEASKSNFNLDEKNAYQAWSRIEILHVYGSLGKLDSENPLTFRPYTPEITGQSLQIAANGIKVIPESREEDDRDFLLAQDWFAWAEEIVFLGFGFDSLNVKRLGLHGVMVRLNLEKRPLPRIWASVHLKTASEQAVIYEALCNGLKWIPLDHQNLDALRNSRIFG